MLPSGHPNDVLGEVAPGPLASATRLVVVFYGSMFLLAACIAWWRGYLAHWIPGEHAPLHAACGVGLGLAVVLASRLCMRVERFAVLAREFSRLLQGTTVRQVVLFAVLSGIAEEALFRGVLQTEIGLIGATLLFGGLHVGPAPRYLAWTVFALVVGLLIGLLYRYSGTLTGPVVAHATINLCNLHYLGKLEEPGPGTMGGGEAGASGAGSTRAESHAARASGDLGASGQKHRSPMTGGGRVSGHAGGGVPTSLPAANR